MIIGITGYSGFIGKHLVDQLSKISNVDIVLIGRKPPTEKPINHDLFDFQSKRNSKLKIDVLIHLAGITKVSEESNSIEFNFNYEGTKKLIESYDFDHILFASTLKAGGDSTEYNSMERAYIQSKLKAEKLIKSLDKGFTILRLGHCYGKYDLGDRLIPTILKASKEKKELQLKLNSFSQLSFLSGDDFSKIVEPLIFEKSYHNQTVNIYNPNYIYVSDIINIIHGITSVFCLKASDNYPIIKPFKLEISSNSPIKDHEFVEFKVEIKKIWNCLL
jgi:nucleoside-diphosphate-sugar epimerase